MVLTEFDEIKYAEVLREDGRMDGFKEGLLEGKFLSICELVNDGLLPLEEALKKVNMNETEFRMKAQGLGIIIHKN